MIHVIVGARPNYMKVKLLVKLVKDLILIHTGQHYTPELYDKMLIDLDIKKPDVVLHPTHDNPISTIISIMRGLYEYWSKVIPSLVIVVGDVNSTLAASLVANKLGFPLIHIEAGLRSFDRSMPEEINRILVDNMADLLFCTEQSAIKNLKIENISGSFHLVGNTMIDCYSTLEDIVVSKAERIKGNFGLLTLHRPSNVDDINKLNDLLIKIDRLGYKFIWPAHPRLSKKLERKFTNIQIVNPMLYTDFMAHILKARFVLTDSGGIQEETTYLNIPCITFRKNTERPITLTNGTNILLNDIEEFDDALAIVKSRYVKPISLWDGRATYRILDIIHKKFD